MITHKSIGYSGRLGNQMFQYAAAKAQSLRLNVDCYLPDHTAIKQDGCFDYTNNKWIQYKLDLYDCFNITAPLLNQTETNSYIESNFSYETLILEVSDNTAIEGYFQSYKYFEDCKDVIFKEFTFKDEILNKCKAEVSKYTNPVAIHIRRGDQVAHPNMWNVSLEYIQAALEQFSDEEYTFLIFSDDIEWCKQVFPEGVVFMEGNNQYEDLCLMSLCNHNVISNSSYSWWAAYLNINANKKVVVPSNWFIPAKSLTDLYLSEWIQI
jgi:hypothetical protein